MKLGTVVCFGSRNILVLKGKSFKVRVKVSQVIKVILVRGQTAKLPQMWKNVKLATVVYFGCRNILVLKGKRFKVKVKVTQVIKVI